MTCLVNVRRCTTHSTSTVSKYCTVKSTEAETWIICLNFLDMSNVYRWNLCPHQLVRLRKGTVIEEMSATFGAQ